jgi:predicted nucleic acid-binding protein
LIKLFLLGKEKVWMDYFYFDASALAKRYAPETGTDAVNQIFENTALERLMCLTIGATEVVWILVRKRNDGRVSQNFFLQALLNLRDEVIDNPDFTTITVDNLTVIDSIGFIIQHSINSTDAIVLASAFFIAADCQTALILRTFQSASSVRFAQPQTGAFAGLRLNQRL